MQTLLRVTPKLSKGSLGGVERFHQTAQGMARTFKMHMERKYDLELEHAFDRDTVADASRWV